MLHRKTLISVGIGLLLGTTVAVAQQPESPTLRGSNGRMGLHQGNQSTYNPGRMNLRWWDPIIDISQIIDNQDLVNAIPAPPGDWNGPTGIEAFNSYNETWTPPYSYAFTVNSLDAERYWQIDPNDPGTLRTYTFRFGGTVAGEEYQLFVHIPIGPTDVDNGAGVVLKYPQRFYVYEITGVQNLDNPGQPIYQKVDTFSWGGGWVALGDNGAPTDVVFAADGSGTIQVRLLNTIPKDSNGLPYDVSGDSLVYGDAAKAVKAFGDFGTISATPIVDQITGADPWRVEVPRNEPFTTQVGSDLLEYNLGIITSFRWSGAKIDVADPGYKRRNILWSWPAKRPFDTTTVEHNRYTLERGDFVNGNVGTYTNAPTFSHAYTTIDKDNLSSGVTESGGWVVDTAIPNFKAVDYLRTGTIVGPATERVSYVPKLTDGDYQVYMWRSGNHVNGPKKLRVEVYEGGAIGGAFGRTDVEVDESGPAGWVRLETAARKLFTHTQASRLAVAVSNGSNDASDAGTTAVADSIRFVRQSDLRITSTLAAANVLINVSGSGLVNRDVIIAAMENGKIYCLDAAGLANGTTICYWSYPSETNGADPNWVAGEDGVDGMAENPIGFDLSSALIERVPIGGGGFVDLLYIGSRNGRVYCIDMGGRGDNGGATYGTTTRRWTYPDDFNPSTPNVPIAASNLGPIVGSVAYGIPTGSIPMVYVPTSQGRVYALDALGNPATKTTSEIWTYPLLMNPVIDPVHSTPIFQWDRVFFQTGDAVTQGSIYSVNAITGGGNWSYTDASPSGTTSPVMVPDAEFGLPAANHGILYAGFNDGRVLGFDSNLGGPLYVANDNPSMVSGPLSYTRATVYNNAGALQQFPLIVAPHLDGRYTSYFITQLNKVGGHRAWEFNTESDKLTGGVATGGDLTLGYSWMYGFDDLGYLYAWNDDPTKITPGTQPGGQSVVENDPTKDDLDDIVAVGKVSLVPPSIYEQIVTGIRNATITYPQMQTLINNNAVTRTNFEYGETLYIIVWDLLDPNSFATPLDYYVQMRFNSPGASAQRREIPLSPYLLPSAPNNQSRVAFSTFPILGTGGNALAPGTATLTTSIIVPSKGNTQQELPAPYSPINFRLANPLAVQVNANANPVNTIGVTTDPTNNEVLNNGNLIGPPGGTSFKGLLATMRPDLDAGLTTPGQVAHGQPSFTRVDVFDRSLMTLLYGPQRGLQNIRMSTNDLGWIGGAASVYKPLNQALYNTYEELPVFAPNISQDYPDVRRENILYAKDALGNTENPLFTPVGLMPPLIPAAAQTAYRDALGYNQGLVGRTLVPTNFFSTLNVPLHQPPGNNGANDGTTPDYRGANLVYIDTGRSGRDFQNNTPMEAYRQFDLGADVAIDERMTVGTPTIDLGSLPAGGAFIDDVLNIMAPWVPSASQIVNFSPWNLNPGSPVLNNLFFQQFSVFNEGNVNMLNVRLAKSVSGNPVGIASIGNDFNAWLDARWYLYSDLDPRYAPFALGNTVILQKPRPSETVGNRLSVNPQHRSNANMGVVAGSHPLLNVNSYPTGDPRIGVAAPIGAPAGEYVRKMYVFEDRGASLALPDLGADSGFLGWPVANPLEPFADPGMVLKYTVRETRMTNRETTKAGRMVDPTSVAANEPFTWANRQPTAMRDGLGNLIVAFASNRLDAGNAPGFNRRPKTPGDAGNVDQDRIYISFMEGRSPATSPLAGPSSIRDLDGFVPNAASNWFRTYGPFPDLSANPVTTLFDLSGSDTVESVKFSDPSFPPAGVFDPLQNITIDGRTSNDSRLMSFTGTVRYTNERGEKLTKSRVFMVQVNLGNTGITGVVGPVPLALDSNAMKGRPSLIQQGNNAAVFYTSNSADLGQLCYNHFNGAVWDGPTRTFSLSNAFENVAHPSVTLRQYLGNSISKGPAIADLIFTAKVRGRMQSEVYYGRFNLNGSLNLQQGDRSLGVALPTRTDQLTYDSATTTYWANGVELRLENLDLNDPNLRINLFKRDPNNPSILISIVDFNTRKVDRNTKTVSFDTTYGGKVFIDCPSGSVRFSGAMMPRSLELLLRYAPRFERVSQGIGANYRGTSMVFDQRFIATSDFWLVNNGGGAVNPRINPTDTVRHDRFVMSFARSSTDGTQTNRPFMKTYRMGINLPTSVRTVNGNLTNMTVTTSGPSPAFYQVDPAKGKLYFDLEQEDATITVTYAGVDENGNPYPSLVNYSATCGMIEEYSEFAIPIEQAVNESAVSLALDPMNNVFNQQNFRRPGLMWMLWSSTRSGGSDLYFQTMAPRFDPVP